MSDPNESLEESLFQAALERSSPEERAAFLDAACRDQPALRARLELLVEGCFGAAGFLPDQPAGQPALVPANEKAGDRIGRYKLREKIGEGGCGVVYVAEQEEPVHRKVALKVIKLGMDTKNVIARFEAERQALAMMDHPNIAKVLDAGATETGRPYFVMELVRGVKITDYCDRNQLSTRERVELFIQVCQAVQHAHQKGVIHRDLKPSNILVTAGDPGAPGVPKVIDFGIAKATEGKLTDLTVYTDLHQFIGTPAYMSPEQATMTSLDMDTRSDIYSLGVLLYELLTGHTPFDTKELMALSADELRRTIREKEPARPSTRLSTMLEGELATTAQQRASEPPRLIHQVRGDLDWIVMKCLEKDRTRRYDTATGLIGDIQRHLQNEPVIARPPTSLYRFQKLVRRNKGAFAAATAVFVALLAGLVVSTFLLIRERQARSDTQAALARESLLRQKVETREKITEASVLFDAGKYGEAENLLNRIPPALVQPDAAHAGLRRGLGWWYGIHEQWKEASANLFVLFQVDALENWNDRSMDCQLIAPAMIKCGDTNRYEEFRQAAISRFAGTTNTIIAARICRISLLVPADDKTMSRLAPLYEVMIRGQRDPDMAATQQPWVYLSLALVDYRRCDCPKSIEWCRLSLKAPMGLGQTAGAQAILAMAYRQLHQDADSRAALTVARLANDTFGVELPSAFNSGKRGIGDLYPVFDGLTGQTLLNQASLLIQGSLGPGGGDYAAARYDLGIACEYGTQSPSLKKDLAQAITWYRKAVDAGSFRAMNTLAWLLATSPDAKMRNGPEAVTLARKTVEAGPKRAPFLDALAAAYAETGQFDKAVSIQNQAIQFAPSEDFKKKYIARLKLYESKSPYRVSY